MSYTNGMANLVVTASHLDDLRALANDAEVGTSLIPSARLRSFARHGLVTLGRNVSGIGPRTVATITDTGRDLIGSDD